MQVRFDRSSSGNSVVDFYEIRKDEEEKRKREEEKEESEEENNGKS